MRTSNIVPDGTVNNLFADISRLDRVYGRVNLRKIYAGVNNALTDTYLGAHMIVSAPPADGNVHACIFSTDSHSDERSGAQSHIESYLVASTPAAFYLLGRTGGAEPIVDPRLTLDSIAYCLIGGATLAGGRGSLGGSLITILLMIMLLNVLGHSGVGIFYQQIVRAVLLLVIVIAYNQVERRQHKGS